MKIGAPVSVRNLRWMALVSGNGACLIWVLDYTGIYDLRQLELR
jgi:hypothetical protein